MLHRSIPRKYCKARTQQTRFHFLRTIRTLPAQNDPTLHARNDPDFTFKEDSETILQSSNPSIHHKSNQKQRLKAWTRLYSTERTRNNAAKLKPVYSPQIKPITMMHRSNQTNFEQCSAISILLACCVWAVIFLAVPSSVQLQRRIRHLTYMSHGERAGRPVLATP